VSGRRETVRGPVDGTRGLRVIRRNCLVPPAAGTTDRVFGLRAVRSPRVDTVVAQVPPRAASGRATRDAQTVPVRATDRSFVGRIALVAASAGRSATVRHVRPRVIDVPSVTAPTVAQAVSAALAVTVRVVRIVLRALSSGRLGIGRSDRRPASGDRSVTAPRVVSAGRSVIDRRQVSAALAVTVRVVRIVLRALSSGRLGIDRSDRRPASGDRSVTAPRLVSAGRSVIDRRQVTAAPRVTALTELRCGALSATKAHARPSSGVPIARRLASEAGRNARPRSSDRATPGAGGMTPASVGLRSPSASQRRRSLRTCCSRTWTARCERVCGR
jgi:hypothetical protein